MTKHSRPIRNALLAATVLASPALAAEVTPERLLNPDKEPQNWLMNHRDFGAQRHSRLDMINKSNVKNLRLLFAVALGGTSGNEALDALCASCRGRSGAPAGPRSRWRHPRPRA